MKKLFRHLKSYTKEVILSPAFKMLEALLELIVPLIIAKLIDDGIQSSNNGYVVGMCLILVALGAVGLLFSVTAQYYAAKASCGFVGKIRHTLFSHIQSFSYTELDELGTSTLITRMTADTNQIQTGLNLTLRLLLRSPFVVFGAMIMAFTIDTKSALSFAAVIPALSIVVFGIMLISMPLYKKVQSYVDKISLSTRENLKGARVIRAFCLEEREIDEFNERNNTLTGAQKFVGRISALMNPFTYILINFAIIILIYTGAIQVKLGDLTQGQVIALYNYMTQILVELVKLANLIISITKALASAGRIQNVLDKKTSMTFGEKDFCNLDDDGIEFKNVSLAYKGAGDTSLSNISFTAKKGETIGIIGGTGSGKTSLVNLIPRFYDATDGEVVINGINIKEYTKESLRERISIVPQHAALFSGTIRDNMKWGNKNATDEDISRALSLSQALEVVDDKGGLDAIVEAGGRNFSGGQRQRLTIARALVKNPAVLILDDSASALDYATDAKLRSAIAGLGGGITVFIVSQRASSVMSADKILVMDDSEIVDIGTHDELLSSSELYKEIYETQFSVSNEEVAL